MVPLRVALVSLVACLVVLMAAGIGIPSYLNTRMAVRELSQDYLDEAVQRSANRTQAFLDSACPILEMSHDVIAQDPGCQVFADHPPDRMARKAQARLLAIALQANPQFNKIFYADRWGQRTSAFRDATKGVQVEDRWTEGAQTWHVVSSVQDITTDPQPTAIAPYDPRTRPWYAAVRDKPGLVWLAPHQLHTNHKYAITVASPLTDTRGELVGVFGIDLQLDELSDFIKQVSGKVGGQSQVFILTGDGRVVAQPNDKPASPAESEPVAEEDVTLVQAGESGNPVLQALSPHLTAQEGNLNETSAGHELSFDIGDTPYLGDYRPLSDRGDLHWIVALALPAKQVLGVVVNNTAIALSVSVLCLILATIFMLIFSEWVSRPLEIFSDEMQKAGRLVFSPGQAPASPLSDVQIMGETLGAMKASLRTFEKYVPSDLVRLILKSGHEAKLGGQVARLTVFSADVVGFASIAETMTPTALVEALGAYLEDMERLVSKHGGILDNIGSAVMAFWGVPLRPAAEPEVSACLAALEYLANHASVGDPLFDTCIGIHTGAAVVGNIGSQRRMSYTAIGDNVDFARRLEALNRVYSTRILISESTWKIVNDRFETRPIDRVAVKGCRGSLQIYELLARRGELQPFRKQAIDAYAEGLVRCCEADFTGAKRFFERALELDPSDGPSRFLLERCQSYEKAPPVKWGGVFLYDRM